MLTLSNVNALIGQAGGSGLWGCRKHNFSSKMSTVTCCLIASHRKNTHRAAPTTQPIHAASGRLLVFFKSAIKISKTTARIFCHDVCGSAILITGISRRSYPKRPPSIHTHIHTLTAVSNTHTTQGTRRQPAPREQLG